MPDMPAGNRKRRVLVLDDDESVRDVIWHRLDALGYECTAVSAGEDAISQYRDAFALGSGFDMVILDLAIPGGMGGTDVLRELKRMDPDVRAIVASGYSGEAVTAK